MKCTGCGREIGSKAANHDLEDTAEYDQWEADVLAESEDFLYACENGEKDNGIL